MPSAVVPFVGPSYELANMRADAQRTVNMYPVRVESGTGKSQFFLKSVPGLNAVVSSTTAGKITCRGLLSRQQSGNNIVYAVLGDGFYELDGATLTSRGTITGSNTTLTVWMAHGRDHVVIVNRQDAFYYTFATSTLAQITDVDLFADTSWVAYLAGRFVFGNRFSDQFQWTGIDAPNTIDALDFATAESSPDGLMHGIVYREELWLFGSRTVEVWRASSSADSAFERNTGVSISVGCAAPYAISTVDNSLFWIGGDDSGGAIVYRASGYQPQRISNHAIEEKLLSSTNLEGAVAYSYQLNGSVFYCINAPGLDTTLCYELTTNSWFDMAEFFNGDFEQHRITHHAVAPDGTHLFGGTLTTHPTLSDRAVIYTHDFDTYTFEGDVICRERTSPHFATPQYNTVFYPRFRLDCSVGGVVATPKYVQLYYSNDGGATFSASALQRSLGESGDRRVMVQWNRLGSGRDRVWKIRCTDDVAFDIVGADIQAVEGVS